MYPVPEIIERIQSPRPSETLCVKDYQRSSTFCSDCDIRGRCASSATDRSYVTLLKSLARISETYPTSFVEPQRFRTREVSVKEIRYIHVGRSERLQRHNVHARY